MKASCLCLDNRFHWSFCLSACSDTQLYKRVIFFKWQVNVSTKSSEVGLSKIPGCQWCESRQSRLCYTWLKSRGLLISLLPSKGLNICWLKLSVDWKEDVLWQSWCARKCLFKPPLCCFPGNSRASCISTAFIPKYPSHESQIQTDSEMSLKINSPGKK